MPLSRPMPKKRCSSCLWPGVIDSSNHIHPASILFTMAGSRRCYKSRCKRSTTERCCDHHRCRETSCQQMKTQHGRFCANHTRCLKTDCEMPRYYPDDESYPFCEEDYWTCKKLDCYKSTYDMVDGSSHCEDPTCKAEGCSKPMLSGHEGHWPLSKPSLSRFRLCRARSGFLERYLLLPCPWL